MCVVSHGYGGLGGGEMMMGDGVHAGQSQGVAARRKMSGHFPSAR